MEKELQNKYYDLNWMQYGFYVLENLDKSLVEEKKFIIGSAFYDNSKSFDAEVMKKAYFYVLDQNDAFRIRLVKKRGRIKQIFQPTDQLEGPSIDKIIGGREEFLKYCNSENAPKIEALDKQLTYATIYECSEGSGGIIIWQNHICSDGYSSAILYEQLSQAYAIIKAGKDLPEINKKYTFEKYIQKQSRKMEWDNFKWWWKKYNHHLSKYAIPIPNCKEEKEACVETTKIDGEFYNKFEKTCLDLKCSDNALLMSALAILIKKTSMVNRFSFSMICHGRTTYAEKHTTGSLLYKTDLLFEPGENSLLSSFIKQTYSTILDTIIHGFYNMYEEFILKLLLNIFRVGLTRELDWLEVNNLRGYTTKSNNTLEFILIDQEKTADILELEIRDLVGEEGIILKFFYDTAVFSKEKVSELKEMYIKIIRFIIDNQDKTIENCMQCI